MLHEKRVVEDLVSCIESNLDTVCCILPQRHLVATKGCESAQP